MNSPSISTILITLLLLVCCGACRSEGHRYVDEMAATLEAGAEHLTSGKTPEAGAQAALEYFEEHAVDMRIIQSRLDDTVRTLNRYQREELAEYARARLARLRAVLKQLPAGPH